MCAKRRRAAAWTWECKAVSADFSISLCSPARCLSPGSLAELCAPASRRPADVYLPAWDGSPTALDLAITGPTRSETLATACQVPLAAASAYAALKASDLNTAQTCASQGVRFQPLVAESTGAWEPAAAKLLARIARAAALPEGVTAAGLQELLQELCVASRSSHGRSVLSRRALPAPSAAIAQASAADVLAQPATDSGTSPPPELGLVHRLSGALWQSASSCPQGLQALLVWHRPSLLQPASACVCQALQLS